MNVTPLDITLVGTGSEFRRSWIVYEHHLTTVPGLPPQLIYVGVSTIAKVWTMDEARCNSEWLKLTNDGTLPVMLRIIAIAPSSMIARSHAITHIAQLASKPVCNANGYNLQKLRRALVGSNGKTYANQIEASEDLGVSQAAVSQHVRGKIAHIKGVTLRYQA